MQLVDPAIGGGIYMPIYRVSLNGMVGAYADVIIKAPNDEVAEDAVWNLVD